MTIVAGGLRARLIHDSLYQMLLAALTDLDWFDSGRQHAAINFIARPVANDEEIPLNTVALVDEDQRAIDEELGSVLAEHRWTYYVDFYAEDDVIGKHLIYDVRDILSGRMPSIGRGDPSLEVLDYRQATPSELFTVEIEDVIVDRAHDFPKPWQRHWYAARFSVVDHYGSDTDA